MYTEIQMKIGKIEIVFYYNDDLETAKISTLFFKKQRYHANLRTYYVVYKRLKYSVVSFLH